MKRFQVQWAVWRFEVGERSAWVRWLRGLLFYLVALAAHGQGVPTTFGMTPVSSSSSQAVTFTASSAGTIGSIVFVTEGLSNLQAPQLSEFKVTSSTCNQGDSLAPGESCTVDVTFSPRLPGIRQGAVLLEDSSNHVLASAPLSGIGQGGLPVLMPATINTVAGNGQLSFDGDGQLATLAAVNLPQGLAADAAGNLYFCDTGNNRVRRIDALSQNISTVAGDGTPGSSGDGGPAVSAELSGPAGLVLDGAGNLYIADRNNNAIRRVDAVSGIITTVAGELGIAGYTGDGQPAASATLSAPRGLALTPLGDLVIADTGNNAVRFVSFSDGKIRTIAGTGTPGFAGDGGPANQAQLSQPYAVAVSANGLAIADFGNERIRFVALTGNITTIAGTGQPGYGGDGNPATQALLNSPAAVAFDPAGDLFIADSDNNRVRMVSSSTQTIVTFAGIGAEAVSSTSIGDGGEDLAASLDKPYALLFDSVGNLWISDYLHSRIREINGSLLALQYPPMKVGKTSAPIEGTLYNGGNANLTLATPVTQNAALDPGTTTCDQTPGTPMPPSIACTMGVEFTPQQVGDPNNNNMNSGSVQWPSDAPNVTPKDALSGEVLSVEPSSVAITSSANPACWGSRLS